MVVLTRSVFNPLEVKFYVENKQSKWIFPRWRMILIISVTMAQNINYVFHGSHTHAEKEVIGN